MPSAEEDMNRLPEGFQRLAYDADTGRYTFRDADGSYYQSEPGQEYGVLEPIDDPSTSLSKSRPDAFASSAHRPAPLALSSPCASRTTFADFVPPELITSPTSMKSPKSPDGTWKGEPKFAAAVRRATLPKMQGVVQNLKRSMTGKTGAGSGAGGKRRAQTEVDEKSMREHLLRQGSVVSFASGSSKVSEVSGGAPRKQ